MGFNIPDREGEILGNKVRAKAIPFRVLEDLQNRVAKGELSNIEAMAALVSDYVTMADGMPIAPDELNHGALAELFAFASEVKVGGVADFTSTPSGAA